MVLFMLGTYSALRVNYIVMVICVTPFVLILFRFLGISYLGVAEERFFDTLLGGNHRVFSPVICSFHSGNRSS